MRAGLCYNGDTNVKGIMHMKRWIAIWMAAALLLSHCALAEADVSRLPAPEEVAEIENIGEAASDEAEAEAPEEEAAEEAAASGEETPEDTATAEGEAQAAKSTEIPEAEPTPEAGTTDEPEATPEPEDSELWFEEGFGLTLPGGWVSYSLSDEDRESGIRYALGDGTGARNLYIQFKAVSVADIAALSEAVENTEGLSKTGDLTFGDTGFVTFIDARQNASCCATLWNDDMLAFVFTPQSDSDFMLTASRIMESFRIL